MASNERIDDIIGEKAFAQLDLLLTKLKGSQTEFAKIAQQAVDFNNKIGQTKDIKAFNDAVKESNSEFSKMETKQKEVISTKKEANKVEQESIKIVKGRLLDQKEEAKLLNSLGGTIEQNIRVNLRLKNELKGVREEQKLLNASSTGNEKVTSSLSNKKAQLALRENELKQALTQNNLELRRGTKEAQASTGSLDQMAVTLDRLRATYRGLNKEERENVEVGGALLASINSYDKQLKDADASQGVFNRSVGNYSNEVKEAITSTGLFSTEMQFLASAQQLYIIGAKGATIATASFSKVLIASGIGAIVILLGSLVAYLTRTQEGMDFVSRAVEGVTTFFTVFLDALTDLGGQLANSFLPLLNSAVKAFTGYFNVLKGIITLDWSSVTKGAEQFVEAVKDGKNAVEGIDSINIIELGKQAGKSAVEASKLRGELQNIEREQKQVDLLRSQSRARIEELKFIAEDQSKSEAERSKASQEALNLEQSLLEKRISLKDRELKAEKALNDLTISTDEDRNNEIDIEIELNELREESVTKQIELNNKLNQLKRDTQAKELERQNKINEEAQKLSDSAFNLEKSRLERSVQMYSEVVEDEKNNYSDRINNLESFLSLSEEKIILERDKELAGKGLFETDKIRITEEAQSEIEAIRRKGAETLNGILAKEIEDNKDALSLRVKNEIDSIKQLEAEKLLALNSNSSLGEKEFQAERLRIIEESNNKVLAVEISHAQDLININKAKGISVIEEERKLAELKLKLSDSVRDNQIKNIEDVAGKESEIADKRKELANEVSSLVVSLINGGFQEQLNNLQRQSDLIDINKAKEIERINSSIEGEEIKASKIKILEAQTLAKKEEISRKERQIKLEQARFEKAVNIAKIIQSTAVGIIEALPNIPLSVLVGAIGAVQLAKVVATKIPAFEKGTNNSPEGVALVGEKGIEGRIDPDGKMSLTPNGPSLTYLKKGSKIIPNHEIKKTLNSPTNQAGKSWDVDRVLSGEIKGLKKAYTERPEKTTIINKSGIHYMYRNGRNRTNYLNKNV